MRTSFWRQWVIGAVVAAVIVPWAILQAKDPESPAKSEPAKPDAAATKPAEDKLVLAVDPKPLSEQVKKGLQYIVNQQDNSGGWGQGGGWRQGQQGGRVEGKDVKEPADVGNTCIALLTLVRAGHTPKEGDYAKNVKRGLEFLLQNVEKADLKSMWVTDIRDTQLQRKIGQYVDTFMTTLVLSELKGKTGDESLDKRLALDLQITINKIVANQQEDGTFAGNTGWASVLSQNLCSKALNRAAQNGADVKPEALARDFKQTQTTLDQKTGEIKGAAAVASASTVAKPVAGSTEATASSSLSRLAIGRSVGDASFSDAGVNLYSVAGNGGRFQDQGNTARMLEKRARETLARADITKEDRTKAEKDLDTAKEITAANESAVQGLVKKLDDKQFLAGFGNNGGEEFLSYMNISEMLVVKGGNEWKSWDRSITDNLNRIQNQDGSWSGQHCITGRTFCSATALLTLMADRTPVPLSAKIKGQK